jgi:teichuronic acid biosynthesis glycosyltransferase TuaC
MPETITASPAKPFRVLMVTGIYPTEQRPHAGTFVKTQVDSLIEAGLEVEVLHPNIGQPTRWRYASTSVQIWRKAFSGRYNVINGQYGLWCLICRLQWTTPVVAAYLGDDILGTIKTDGGYSFKGNLVAFLSRQLCYWVEAVIVKSEQMKQVAKGPQKKIFVIPDGINFEQFHPVGRAEVRAELGWEQDKYYVLFGNNPHIPVKNFALAQAAVERVRAKGIDIELVVASGLSHATVVQYMNASNALILSSHAEGSPNVVKEAMACNVPVVATDVGDVRAVIARTQGCTVCTPNNVEEMAAGIEVALAHTERTTGRQDTQHLSSNVIAQQIMRVYEQATGIQIQQQPKESKGEQSTKERAYVQE